MIVVKNKAALKKMSCAGKLLSAVFGDLRQILIAGKTTLEIDEWIEAQLRSRGLVPATKGYSGYKFASCISVNDALIHGIPSVHVVLKPGDLVSVDVVASWKGYCADMARSFIIEGADSKGNDLEAKKRLIAIAQGALDKGIAQARPGNHLSDISAAIQNEVEKESFGVVRDYAGHGIGKSLHEEPEIPNFGKPGKGPVLRQGMTLAIEPMITMGSYKVCTMDDGWTVKTCDHSLAAHVEDTVAITAGDPDILTRSVNSFGGL